VGHMTRGNRGSRCARPRLTNRGVGSFGGFAADAPLFCPGVTWKQALMQALDKGDEEIGRGPSCHPQQTRRNTELLQEA